MINNDEKIKFLGKLHINFKRSETIYQNYIDNKKQFLFAKILKRSNEETLNLLKDNSYLLSDELINDSIKLICHLDIWIEKWNALANKNKPNLNDEFVFENSFRFPKDAAQNLDKEFIEIRDKKN